MREKIRHKIEVFKKFIKFFMQRDKLERAAKTGVWAALYRGAQYFIIILTGSLVAGLQKFGFKFIGVFLVLFAGNLLITGGVIIASNQTETDFTFMKGLRSIINEAFALSKMFGILLESIAFVVLLIWSGADQFIIFFDKRFSSCSSKVCIFVLASMLSMAVWTHVYIGAATGFWNLIEILRK